VSALPLHQTGKSRKERLQACEEVIAAHGREFLKVGLALKEIRDYELYKDAGFDTWDGYLKQRIGEQFGIEEAHTRRLILCAQVRPKLPDPINPAGLIDGKSGEDWSQKALLEFARLAPRKKEPGQPFDLDWLDGRDVKRVARKVIEHCEKEGTKPTAATVRKFVDEDLGIDRVAQARETQRRNEEERTPELREYLIDMTGSLEVKTEKLATLNKEAWKLFDEDNPRTVERLIAACTALIDLLKGRHEERRQS
jgi:hypothetical protein